MRQSNMSTGQASNGVVFSFLHFIISTLEHSSKEHSLSIPPPQAHPGHLSIVGVQEWQQSTLLVQCWDHLQLHMLVILLLQTRRCLEVQLHILLQTKNGGKRLTKNFRHGLALLVPQWS